MLSVDGSDGGGQLLRTGLALAARTGTPVRFESIRGSRPDPGLRPQHLAAVELLAQYCDADLKGAPPDSETLVFEPGESRTHSLSVDIPTAGSATLLLDAVLPLVTVIDEPLTVTATGGTDVKWSPPVAYVRHVKLPLLARFGLDAALERTSVGYYPVGDGGLTFRLPPSSLSPIELGARGSLEAVDVYSKASTDLEDSDVADRQADRTRERLDAANVPLGERTVEYVETDSTGSSITVRARYDRTLAGFDALGEPGRPSETVADIAIDDFERFHGTRAAVDRHMADQLLVFLALVGGRVAIPEATDHVQTHRSLLAEFGYEVSLESTNGVAILSSPIDSTG